MIKKVNETIHNIYLIRQATQVLNILTLLQMNRHIRKLVRYFFSNCDSFNTNFIFDSGLLHTTHITQKNWEAIKVKVKSSN